MCIVTIVIHQNSESEALTSYFFADVQRLVHESEESLKEHSSSFNSTCEEYDMMISINKTETMKVSRTPGTLNININDTILKQVKEFKYLCSIFTEDGQMNREIEKKGYRRPTMSATGKEQNHKLHLRIDTDIPMPNLDHDQASGAQNYNLRTEMLTKSCQQDQKRYDSQHQIREMVGTKSICHHIQQQRIKWFGHLTRLPIQHPAQRAYNTRFSGHKARGRPRKIWINGVKETISLYNILPAQAFRRAADRRLLLPTSPQVVKAVDKSKVKQFNTK